MDRRRFLTLIVLLVVALIVALRPYYWRGSETYRALCQLTRSAFIDQVRHNTWVCTPNYVRVIHGS